MWEKLAIYGYWNLLNTILSANIVNEFATVGHGQRNPQVAKSEAPEEREFVGL